MKKIVIEFPYVFVSVNSQYGAGRREGGYPMTFLTMDARVYKETVMWEAKRAYDGQQMRLSSGRVWVIPADGSEWTEFVGDIKKDIVWK